MRSNANTIWPLQHESRLPDSHVSTHAQASPLFTPHTTPCTHSHIRHANISKNNYNRRDSQKNSKKKSKKNRKKCGKLP